jgi:uncharacterized protein (DUF1499 family)
MRMATLGWVILALALAGLAYIRFGPTDTGRWHRPIDAQSNQDVTGGAIRVVQNAPQDALTRVDAEMQALPRTRLIAGSVQEGRITYETRSLLFGFPDYTTVEHSGDTLKLYARLRFGTSDMGVNRNRLERVLRDLQF